MTIQREAQAVVWRGVVTDTAQRNATLELKLSQQMQEIASLSFLLQERQSGQLQPSSQAHASSNLTATSSSSASSSTARTNDDNVPLIDISTEDQGASSDEDADEQGGESSSPVDRPTKRAKTTPVKKTPSASPPASASTDTEKLQKRISTLEKQLAKSRELHRPCRDKRRSLESSLERTRTKLEQNETKQKQKLSDLQSKLDLLSASQVDLLGQNQVLSTRVTSLEEQLDCVVCKAARRSVVMMPCMHLELCNACYSLQKRNSVTSAAALQVQCPRCCSVDTGILILKIN